MTKKHFKILSLVAVFAWLAGLMFLFYPLHSNSLGTLNMIQILRNAGDPDGLLGFACLVYGTSAVLMLVALLCKGKQEKNAESFFILSTFLPVLFPVIGMLRMNGKLGCDMMYDAYAGCAIFFIVLQAVLLVVFCRNSSARQDSIQ